MQLVAVVKRDCETCVLVAPLLAALGQLSTLKVYSQDDPTFPESAGGAYDDTELEHSYHLGITTVPTLIRYENNVEIARTEGWDRAEWQHITEIDFLGKDLPGFKPGCGSLSQYPGMIEKLALRYGDINFQSRSIEVTADDDPIEVTYDRGWSDGLPVVPPTDLRIARMLNGTTRKATDIVGRCWPVADPSIFRWYWQALKRHLNPRFQCTDYSQRYGSRDRLLLLTAQCQNALV